MRYEALTYFVWFSGLFPALYLRFSSAYHSKEVKFAAPFIWLTAFASLYEPIVTTWLQVNSRIWFTAFSFLEFFCLYLFFSRLFAGKYKSITNGFLAIYCFIYLGLVINAFLEWKFPALTSLTFVEVFFVLLASVLWFKDVFADKYLDSLAASPSFYFISCFILFFSGTVVFLLMHELAAFTSAESMKYLIIMILLTLVQNILLIVGIWKGQLKLNRYSG